MKAQSKAIVASLVVLVLAVCTVSGATYSWFSDSDNTDVVISTGKVSVEGALYEGTDVGTEPLKKLEVAGMLEGQSKTYTYVLENTSTIDVVYRIYLSLVIEDLTEEMDISKFTVGGNSPVLNSLTQKYEVVISDWSDWPSTTDSLVNTFNIILEHGSNMQGVTISGSLIAEAYQYNYPYDQSEVEGDFSSGVKLPTEFGTGITAICGSSNVTVQFDADASDNVKGKTMTIVDGGSAYESSDGNYVVFDYDISVDGVSELGGSASVSFTLDGKYENPKVVYDDNGVYSSVPITSCIYSEGKTTITFATTHFSKFVAEAELHAVDADSLRNAVGIAIAGKPLTIHMDDGDYVFDLISITSGKEVSLVGSPKAVLKGQIMTTGVLDVEGICVVGPSVVVGDVSQFSKTALALQNAGKVSCTGVVFDMGDLVKDGTAITAWWSTRDGANILVKDCTFDCAGKRPMRSDACVTVEDCIFNDPYRYAVQMTSKSSTMAAEAEAFVEFNDNIINAGITTENPVYGVQLEGGYGCSDLTIVGRNNVINYGDSGKTGAMYYCECGKVEHKTVVWDVDELVMHCKVDTIEVDAGENTFASLKQGVENGYMSIVGSVKEDGTPSTVIVPSENSDRVLTGGLHDVSSVKNVEFKGANATRYTYSSGTLIYDNCIFNGTEVYGYHVDNANGGIIKFIDCTFIGFNAFAGTGTYYFNNCTFIHNENYGHTNMWGVGHFDDCVFKDMTSLSPKGSGIIYIDGVEESYHHEFIGSADSLFNFAKSVNEDNDSWSGQKVLLVADIDLNNVLWTPIGQTGATTFNGIFDGQNYAISNLNVDSSNQTGKHYSSGFFGWVESHSVGHGHLKNVNIDGATVTGHHNCGALVGYITQQTALVENCHVKNATIICTYANADASGDKAGALIGNLTVATPIKDCTAKDCTVSAGRDAGQVIGAGKESNVTDCSAENVVVSDNETGTGANIRDKVVGRPL